MRRAPAFAVVCLFVASACHREIEHDPVARTWWSLTAIGNSICRWRTENATPCPSVAELEEKKFLLPGRHDGWGRAFQLRCPAASKDTFEVISAGRDGVFGTADDMTSSGMNAPAFAAKGPFITSCDQ